jgi:hypothetical protein
MAFVVKDRVQETTTTVGIGTITLDGASAGYQSFAAVGDGNSTYYCITVQSGTAWEVGIGTYTASGTTLSRDTVLSSSNAGALVDFPAGAKNVFVTYPSSKSVYASNTATAGQTLVANGPSIAPSWQLRSPIPIGGAIPREFGLAVMPFAPQPTTNIEPYIDADGAHWMPNMAIGAIPVPSDYPDLPPAYSPLLLNYFTGTTNADPTQLEPVNFLTSVSSIRMVYGNGVYLTVASGQTGLTNAASKSINGVGWYNARPPLSNYWRDLAFGNNTFVLVGNNQLNAAAPNANYATYDGTTWTARTHAGWASNYIGGIAFGAGLFTTVLYGTTQGYSSADGITWSSTTLPSASNWTRVRFINNNFVAIASGTTAAAYSANGTTWTAATTAASSAWSDVTYANGIYVMISNTAGTTYQTSTDLVTWTSRTFPVSITASNINTDGSKFYVLFEATYYLTSTNGINWEFNPASVANHNDTAYVNGKMFSFAGLYRNSTSNNPCAVLDVPTKYISAGTVTSAQSTIAFAFGGGTYVAITPAQTNFFQYSTNGFTWTLSNSLSVLGANLACVSVAYGAGLFVAVGGSTTQYLTSPDGINWTVRSYTTTSTVSSIVYGGGQFVLVTTGTTVLTSPDGLAWTTRTGNNNSWAQVIYANSYYVAIAANQIQYSTNGITWTLVSFPTSSGYISIAYGNGKWVALTNSTSSSRIAISSNLTSWTEYATLPLNRTWSGIAFADGTFFAVASIGSGATSTDGLTWLTFNNMSVARSITVVNNIVFASANTGASIFVASTNTKNAFRPLASQPTYVSGDTDGTNYIAISDNYLLYSSTPNNAWTINPNTIYTSWARIAYGNGVFVALATQNCLVGTSSNGVNWTFTALFPTGTNPVSSTGIGAVNVRFINNQFVVCFSAAGLGYAYSSDGLTWTYQAVATYSINDMAYGNGYYLATCGSAGIIRATSLTGAWTLTSASTTPSWNQILFANNVFMAMSNVGIYSGRSTDNGSTWSLVGYNGLTQNPVGGQSFKHFFGNFCYSGSTSTPSLMFTPDGKMFKGRPTYSFSSSWMVVGSGNAGFMLNAGGSSVKALDSTFFTGPFSYFSFYQPSSSNNGALYPYQWYVRIK